MRLVRPDFPDVENPAVDLIFATLEGLDHGDDDSWLVLRQSDRALVYLKALKISPRRYRVQYSQWPPQRLFATPPLAVTLVRQMVLAYLNGDESFKTLSSWEDVSQLLPDPEEVTDDIIANGKSVFTHEWDNDEWGAGCEEVFCLDGRFAISSLDFGNAGPFDTLEDALTERDLLEVTKATTGIECSLWSAEELARCLVCDEARTTITLNGQEWTYRRTTGRFSPARTGRK